LHAVVSALLARYGEGRPRRRDALMAGLVVREAVTLTGLAERAQVARAFVAGVLGPGTLAGRTLHCW
jgi:hypothetical protein